MPAQFVDARDARNFVDKHAGWLDRDACRRVKRDRLNAPSAIPDAAWLNWASALLRAQPHLAKRLKAKALRPTACERCGTTLTAPESIAAGIGPECQAK